MNSAASAGLGRQALELIAEADALRSLGLDRRAGLWAVKALAPDAAGGERGAAAGDDGPPTEDPADLPPMALPAHVAEDYRTTACR